MDPFRGSKHPKRWNPPPGCMSCEEIRWWMMELFRRGWNRGELQRLLGMPSHDLRKALGKEWIYPTEQIRFSRQLRKVISGELILQRKLRRGNPHKKGEKSTDPLVRGARDVVLADNPEPLRMPMKLVFDIKRGGLKLTPQFVPPENPLPSFARALDKLRYGWRSCP